MTTRQEDIHPGFIYVCPFCAKTTIYEFPAIQPPPKFCGHWIEGGFYQFRLVKIVRRTSNDL